MKTRMMVFMSSVVLAMSVLSFTGDRQAPNPNALAYEDAKENARFKRRQDAFNSKAKGNQDLAEKEAAEARRKKDDASFNNEGKFKVKF